jgi:hypothetical protein
MMRQPANWLSARRAKEQQFMFAPYVKKKENQDGFLSPKEFHRAVNAEMQAIKKMKAIDYLCWEMKWPSVVAMYWTEGHSYLPWLR